MDNEEKTKLYWLAKKIVDITKELEELSNEERRIVFKKVEQKDESSLAELYEAISEYFDNYLGFNNEQFECEKQYKPSLDDPDAD